MLKKAVFFLVLSFITQTKAFATCNTILANIATLVVCKTQLALSHFRSLSARGFKGDFIFDEVVESSIRIAK
jgi:hypothetical protein